MCGWRCVVSGLRGWAPGAPERWDVATSAPVPFSARGPPGSTLGSRLPTPPFTPPGGRRRCCERGGCGSRHRLRPPTVGDPAVRAPKTTVSPPGRLRPLHAPTDDPFSRSASGPRDLGTRERDFGSDRTDVGEG